jgi:hypothetical protein
MSEPTKVPDVPETPEAPQDDVNSEQKGILRDLQAERAKRQDLQKQLEDRIKADEEAETARLTEQQKFQELYEAEKAKVAEYEPVVENYNTYILRRKRLYLNNSEMMQMTLAVWMFQRLKKLSQRSLNYRTPLRSPENRECLHRVSSEVSRRWMN